MSLIELIAQLNAIPEKHGRLPVLDNDSSILKPHDLSVLYLEGDGRYMDECAQKMLQSVHSYE
ncbi:hypothetical protein QE320_gp049 [Pseudomonas phage EM]|uniref:Uncharacterized protein n=1 Tax=Pseudomonas phage EM TaxID=2936914 RepID=A0AAE9HJ75_9CAUD|nr:hypothetical protein QE320_gp049 [Pseudomonas phage EM]UPW35851.1 hypothetical protein EM_049 [Pseudomonas phage EM]